jgi:hypothetical protein
MTKEQAETLKITMQVLTALVTAQMALNKGKEAEFAAILGSAAREADLHPTAKQMLNHLAQGPSMFASLGKTVQ